MIGGRLSWYWALMWSLAAAPAAARLLLREGFSDVSLRLGGSRGAKAIGAFSQARSLPVRAAASDRR